MVLAGHLVLADTTLVTLALVQGPQPFSYHVPLQNSNK